MNFKILDKVEQAGSKIVIVTKYFDAEATHKILHQVQSHPAFLALGENRIKDLQAKNLPREKVHFIGNLQSRDLSNIVEYASAIHSLCEVKHAEKLHDLLVGGIGQSRLRSAIMDVFLQVNISRESQKSGILPEDFARVLQKMQSLSHLKILGISSIGAGKFEEDSKRREFQELKSLRDQYLPNGKISAGTSRDWEIALREGIEVVRVGQAFFDEY